MRTVALRFADNIAPPEGTIAEHEKIIDELGYVWYGKFGARVSDKNSLLSLRQEINVFCLFIAEQVDAIGSI